MARSMYKISYVEPSKQQAWRDYWVNGTGEHDASLGWADYLPAKNLYDAIQKVRRKYPNYVVMREGSGRIGGA